MSRVKNYKIFLVLAVIVAGVVCMFLPDKNPVPVASMSGALEKNVVGDTAVMTNKADSASINQKNQ